MANFRMFFAGLVCFILPHFYFISVLYMVDVEKGTPTEAPFNGLLSKSENGFSDGYNINNTGIDLVKQNIADNSVESVESAGRWPGLQLTVQSGNEISITLVLYHDGMNPGLDPGYDIGLLSANPAFQLYTRFINNNGVKYMQQALPISGCDTLVVPIGFDYAAGGEVKFSAVTEPLEKYEYILEDRVTGKFKNIALESYTVTLPAGTEDTGRFFLHTRPISSTGTGSTPDNNEKPGLLIWTSGNSLSIKGEVSEKAILSIYDLQARLILKTRLSEGSLNTLFFPGIKSGIYAVKIVDEKKVTTKMVEF
jgi:hypothetical protein